MIMQLKKYLTLHLEKIILIRAMKNNAINAGTALMALPCLFMANTVYAISCSTNNNSGLSYHTATLSGITPPAFNPNSFAIGDTIYNGSGNVSITNYKGNSPTFSCTDSWIWYNKASMGTAINNIYPTSINGMGLRVKEAAYWPYLSVGTYTANQNISYGPTYPIKIELIKTGEITASGSISGEFGGSTANTENGPWLIKISWASPVVILPTVPTCSVSTPSITVPLTNPPYFSFKGIGTTTGDQTFQIGLTCSGGSLNTSTNTYITFTDANQPGNTSTTLSLPSSTGNASGLGLQILNGGTPIGYGPDSSAPGNTNQWKVGNIAQGVSAYNIPLTVRYIQTGATVTAGKVTGRATFTLSYQ